MFYSLYKGDFYLLLIFIFLTFLVISLNIKKKNYLFFFFILSGILLVNRTLIILSLITILIVNFKRVKTNFAIIVFAVLSIFVFYSDIQSNTGRAFILKNSFKLLTQNFLGYGWGSFKKKYLLQQATYFKQNGIGNYDKALVADNTQFAFNDYIQYAIELGVIPVILFIGFNLFLLLKGYKKSLRNNDTLMFALSVALTQILVAASFYFVFYNFYFISFYLYCCISIILILCNIRNRFLLLFLSLLILGVLTFNHNKQSRLTKSIGDANNISLMGYKSIADSIFYSIPNKYRDANYLMTYSQHNFRFGKIDSAIYYMESSASLFSNSEQYLVLGDYYLQRKQYSQAEFFYETALYMVPNRFRSRDRLANFYRLLGNKEKEKYWLKSIVDFPEKIPSNVSKQIKQRAALRLEGDFFK